MAKSVAVITVHGMGQVANDYNIGFVRRLQAALGERASQIHFETVYYKDLLVGNEARVWDASRAGLRWAGLRRFFLFAFSDAASLESGKGIPRGIYWQSQVRIARALLNARDVVGDDGCVVIVAHSLGCEVVSCYFWDAGARVSGEDWAGVVVPTAERVVVNSIWKNFGEAMPDIAGERALGPKEEAFLRGSRFRLFVTTGCNIPVFVAAHATRDVCPISTGTRFRWHNYYSPFDPLGWPLATLSREYARVVMDHRVMPCAGVRNGLLLSWNPGSHLLYWASSRVVDAVARQVLAVMSCPTVGLARVSGSG